MLAVAVIYFDFNSLPSARCLHFHTLRVRNRKTPVSANGLANCRHVAFFSDVLGRPGLLPDICLTSVQLVADGPPIAIPLPAAVLPW